MLETISKLSVAEEQLITAIQLYFEGSNPVSVHTLARAAHEILDSICAFRKLERGVVQQGLKWIKPEFKKTFLAKTSEAKNFFKHADKDPDPEGAIEWNPELSTHYIFDATSLYRRITNNPIPCEIMSFILWYRIKNPDMWENTPVELEKNIAEAKKLLEETDKQDVYNILMQICKLNKSQLIKTLNIT